MCDVSSLVPEIHAAIMALDATNPHTALTILTDSASLIWIVEALNQELFWRDFRKHPQQDAIAALIDALDRHLGPLLFAKVAAHKGCCMNEIADRLAEEGACKPLGEIERTYITEYDEDIPIIRAHQKDKNKHGANQKWDDC
jgi:ribonuclease HI